jgi:rhodanese-related sulfurtransferase
MVRDITPQEAHALVRNTPGLFFVDVRSQGEFAQGHPQGAVNVPIADVDAHGRMAPNPQFTEVMTTLVPETTATIVFTCAAGGRSRRAAEVLASLGYTQTINMDGGFNGGGIPGWRACGLPVSHTALEGGAYEAILDRLGL